MKIFVTARPRAKKEAVKKIDAAHYVVSVSTAPEDGRANHAVLRALAGYFNVPISTVVLKRGQTSKKKIVEIPDRR